MARLYPPRFPARDESDAYSAAEHVLYHELAGQLGPEYTVLHGVHWLARDTGSGSQTRDGEADFLILHPRRGILILEVKGGTIRYEPITGVWTSRDGGGINHAIKDPFAQARRTLFALRAKLRDAPTTRAFGYPLARAVAFPDLLVNDPDLGLAACRDQIIDSTDLPTIIRALMRVWEHPQASDPTLDPPGVPGEDGIKALVTLLKPPLELARPGLAGAIRREALEMIQLTDRQYDLLDFLAGQRRVAIDGTAGSGKTLLALEQCRRLARQGYRVLFTCYNKALAAWAGEELARDLGPDDLARVTVAPYHDLATGFAQRAGLPLPPEGTLDPAALSRYFQEELPDHFASALESLPDRFDAVIVDEGQDFADTWWLTLELALADPAGGILFIFYDENQRIYDRRGTYPIPPPHYPLRHNLRNTRHIHTAAMHFHRGDDRPDCRGPEGRPVVETGASPEEEPEALRRVLHDLLAVEKLVPADIVILTPRSERTSRLREGTRVGNLTLTWGEGGPSALCVRSIHTFKGLESPVVILAEPERARESVRAPLLYVALSRASHHAIILGSLSATHDHPLSNLADQKVAP